MNSNRLTSEEVSALLAALERPAGQERRRYPRVAVRGRLGADVRLLDGAERRVSAVVRDLSRSGLAVSAAEPAEVGREAEVSVAEPGRPPMLWAACRVAACRPDADADVAVVRYVLGLEFLRIMRGGG